MWSQTYLDFKTKTYHVVLFHDWITAECFNGTLNFTLDDVIPNFSNWEHIGDSVIAFKDCEHWAAPAAQLGKAFNVCTSLNYFRKSFEIIVYLF